MNKNKIIALVLASTAFIAFYWGFMNFEGGSRYVNLFALVMVLACTSAAIAIGNAGER
ncbi:MAG: hypothetical protein OSB25_06870 [Salibacteraceae bacterium]|nr:hypothetical protein [Salibacteraceae bacterium]|tara:strand:- start:35844 stop:36017 length:174 start_codon:yes stop_codon:yes gene_type:complete